MIQSEYGNRKIEKAMANVEESRRTDRGNIRHKLEDILIVTVQTLFQLFGVNSAVFCVNRSFSKPAFPLTSSVSTDLLS